MKILTITSYINSWIFKILGKRSNLLKIINNTGWLFFDYLLRLGFGLVIGVWIARYLGPRQIGYLDYARAYFGIFVVIAALGLDEIVIRDLVKMPARRFEILGSAFSLKLISGILITIISIIIIRFLEPQDHFIQLTVSIFSFGLIFKSFDVIDLWFQSQVLSKYTVLARDAALLISYIGQFAFILLNLQLIAFALIQPFQLILAAIGLIIVYRIQGHSFKAWQFRVSPTKSMLRSSWPLLLAGVSIWIYMRVDQLILGSTVGVEELGIYSRAVRWAEFWFFIPVVITNSFFPSIINAKKYDEQVYIERLQTILNILMAISISIALAVTIFSDFLILLLYGPPYAKAGPQLSILIWSIVFVSMGIVRNKWAITEDLTKFTLISTFTGAAINLVLNLIFIPRYGAIAAALTTLISQFIAAFLINIFHPKARHFFILQLRSLIFWGGIKIKSI